MQKILPPIKVIFGAIIHLSHEKRSFTGPVNQASSGLQLQPVWKCHILDPHLTHLKQCAII